MRESEHLSMAIENAMAGDARSARILEDEIERRGLWQGYIRALGIIGSQTTNPPIYGWNDIARALRAAPEQKARAFLEVVGVHRNDRRL